MIKYFIYGICLFLMVASLWATSTVTAVTNVTGHMSNVTIETGDDTYRYSTCNNLTPYTYPWHVSDAVNISVNMGSTAWTLNDLTTAAIAVCIVRTAI